VIFWRHLVTVLTRDVRMADQLIHPLRAIPSLDMMRVIAFEIATRNVSGPMNAVALEPVRNDAFSRDLACALHRPLLQRFPQWLLSGDLVVSAARPC